MIEEVDLKHFLDFLKAEFEKTQSFELLDLTKTDFVDVKYNLSDFTNKLQQINTCVGIDFSPTEIAWCTINSSLNVTEMNYVQLDLDFRNFSNLTQEVT